MDRKEFIQKYGPHIHAVVNNPAQIAALIFLAEHEISNLLNDVHVNTVNDCHHKAAISAGKAEGIKDFLAIVNGVARDYGHSKTSDAQ